MAGVSLISKNNGNLNQKGEAETALDSLNYLGKYKSRVLLNDNANFIGYNTYDAYPIQTYDSPTMIPPTGKDMLDLIKVKEGMIYLNFADQQFDFRG